MNQNNQNTSGHWMVRLAESSLFNKLPAASVRVLLEQIDKISVARGDEIIRQGEAGDYYYIIDSGRCAVSRRDNAQQSPRVLATLGPGEAFGEEEMVTGSTRNADVVMLTDGELLRLKRETFNDVVRDALIDKVPYRIAQRMLEEGARWVDVREHSAFSTSRHFPDAINLPLSSLRENYASVLPLDGDYVICADDHNVASAATLLLVQRNVDAVCLNEPLTDRLVGSDTEVAQDEPETVHEVVVQAREHEAQVADLESSDPIPRDLYDDTYVGQSLADLIDQMHTRHRELLETPNPGGVTSGKETEVMDLDSFEAEVERSLPCESDRLGDATTDTKTNAQPPPEADIASYLDGLHELIRRQVEARLEYERRRLRAQAADKVAAIKAVAVEKVKTQTRIYRERLKTEHEAKHQRLQTQYQKLMGLAHRISRQKAELKRARAELQGKLQATSRLQSELDTLRNTLTQSIGNFDTLDAGDNPPE